MILENFKDLQSKSNLAKVEKLNSQSQSQLVQGFPKEGRDGGGSAGARAPSRDDGNPVREGLSRDSVNDLVSISVGRRRVACHAPIQHTIGTAESLDQGKRGTGQQGQPRNGEGS